MITTAGFSRVIDGMDPEPLTRFCVAARTAFCRVGKQFSSVNLVPR
jgi:hypothetical protein